MLSTPQFIFIQELKQDLHQSDVYQEMYQKYAADPASMPGFTVANGLLLQKGRIWIPSNSRFKMLLMKEFHETPIGGHAGIVVYGKPPTTIPSYVAGSSTVDANNDLLLTREEILEMLKKNLEKAQLRMKSIADGKLKARGKDDTITSRQNDRYKKAIAKSSRARADDVEDSHIQADRVVPINSLIRRLDDQSHTPCIIRHKGKPDGWGIDLVNELDVAIVDDFETITHDVGSG
ncbi:hypothetical protein KIW84_057458 [Lathyrus oleraceus]|uniref:Uncharacterized protein n=1 Tax=Pisum sativum TaxID=3888 RepID=A0A9D5AI89_PEA|nr:hypothetical protein KIW84_057458 [Pisum sativum]